MNNSEYVLPYFIEHLERFNNYILYTDIKTSVFNTELYVYLKKTCKYIRETLLKEPFFNRLIVKNGELCAVFNTPKKYRGIIHTIALTGLNGSNKITLKKMYEQQKTLATQMSGQGYFVLYIFLFSLNTEIKDVYKQV